MLPNWLPWFMCFFVIDILIYDTSAETLPPPCSSEIYCYGRLIDTVMKAHIFNDSKSFVDLKLKQSPAVTLTRFDEFIAQFANGEPSKDQLQAWVVDNFDPKGSELELWTPVDHKKHPEILNRISDRELRRFAKELNLIWIKLSRRMKDDVLEHPELTSIIYVPNPFVIAGGRFMETYYWDSYWIVRGLLVCEMYQTARGIIENLLSLIDRFGMIPNGARVYYLARSHPPLLSPMLKSYIDHTHDFQFAISSIDLLVREFEFFMTNHTVMVKGHRLARYIDRSSGPRPESYREDIEIGKEFEDEEARENFYSEVKAAAESGMDFTSRWFIDERNENTGSLKNMKTRSIITVELNAILHWNAKIIAEFYGFARNYEKQREYEAKAQEIMTAVNEVLWDDEIGIWLDYDLINNKRRPYFTPTNFAPLWTNCFEFSRSKFITDKVLNYINNTKIDQFPGGIPTTLSHTGEQWDFPNCWAPMQHILVYGLENLNDARASATAYKLAQRWVQSNYVSFRDTGAMFEKYIATEFGGTGSGGEYEVQTGFGWTNGVILDFLNRYGASLKSGANATMLTNIIFSSLLLLSIQMIM